MKYNEIALPLETTARELNAKLALASSLAQQGYRCYLGTKGMVQEIARRHGNVIYIDKGFHRGTSEKLYDQLRASGCLLVSLDEENGVDYRDFHMLNTRMPDEFFPYFDLVLLWGRAQYEHLQNVRTTFDEKKVIVTGHPRFDLLKERFRPLYAEKVQELQNKYGDFVLLNTNSKYANNINGRDDVIRNYQSRVKDLQKRLDYDEERLQFNISLALRIADEFGKTVIVRPHPEESIEVYQKVFADQPLIKPIYEDSAMYWILASQVVIHNHSTTGLEAAMLGKAPIAYTPIETEENFCPWIPIACSHQFNTEQDVIDFIAQEGWKHAPEGMDDVLENFFSFSTNATDQVVSAIDRLAKSREFSGHRESSTLFVLKRRIRHMLAGLLGRNTMTSLASNKLQDLRPNTVLKRHKAIIRYLPSDTPVTIKVLHPHLYCVQPK